MEKTKKKTNFSELSREEKEALLGEATKEAISDAHSRGCYTTHGDEKGVYHLYPDGHKEYINPEDGASNE